VLWALLSLHVSEIIDLLWVILRAHRARSLRTADATTHRPRSSSPRHRGVRLGRGGGKAAAAATAGADAAISARQDVVPIQPPISITTLLLSLNLLKISKVDGSHV
jgi:hypothetical protein